MREFIGALWNLLTKGQSCRKYSHVITSSCFNYMCHISVKKWLKSKYNSKFLHIDSASRIILGMGSANERRHYYVMSSLIGWAHAQNDGLILFSRVLPRYWSPVRGISKSWGQHKSSLLSKFCQVFITSSPGASCQTKCQLPPYCQQTWGP